MDENVQGGIGCLLAVIALVIVLWVLQGFPGLVK